MSENNLSRFINAQASVWAGYDVALQEIKLGRKMNHWIWYIFPQLKGLGHSRNSSFYGINGREEAEEYLQNPILGKRLREIATALQTHTDKSAVSILGAIDAVKVQSCMTLFDSISPNDIFGDVLEQFYDGQRDIHSIV